MSKEKETKITSAFDLFLPSIEIVKNNLMTFFILLVLPTLLVNIGTNSNARSLEEVLNPFVIIGSLLTLAFVAPLTYAYVNAAKGEILSLREVFVNGYKFFWRLLGLNIVVGLLVVFGLILLVIPGIIMFRRYFLSPYFLIDQDLSIEQAMKKSKEVSAQNTPAIYGVLGIVLLFAIMGSLFSAIGTAIGMILNILYSVAPSLRYFEMKKAYDKN